MSPPRLRAPASHGEILAVPPLAEAGRLLLQNEEQFAAPSALICGRLLGELRRTARREVELAARQFMIRRQLPVPPASSGLVVTGHQPELFHPGVWIKNFAACGIARRHGLTGLSLIVDNDYVKSVAVKLPRLMPQGAGLTQAPLDRWSGSAPFEELRVRDEATFAAFPEAVRSAAGDWPFQPVVAQLWQLVGEPRSPSPLLGERLAVARHRLEEKWGCSNLEVPLSELCRTETFARFACHLLDNLPRFRTIHNEQLAAYRWRHRLRSKNHPVPALTEQDDWLEAPFWVWRTGEGQRRRLFVRRVRDVLELRHGSMILATLTGSSKPEEMVAQFQAVAAQDYKIRTRALTTTLFARLCVADLFIHGIGGAIYDELTDSILRSFYRIEPPRFLTISGTLRLPFATPSVSAESLRAQRHELRELWYKPERWLKDRNNDGSLRELCAAKASLASQSPADSAAKIQRWRAIQQLNDQLRPYLIKERSFLEQVVCSQENALASRRLLQDREYAFCLHPEESLRGLMETVWVA
jgi:hypothetical protein